MPAYISLEMIFDLVNWLMPTNPFLFNQKLDPSSTNLVDDDKMKRKSAY